VDGLGASEYEWRFVGRIGFRRQKLEKQPKEKGLEREGKRVKKEGKANGSTTQRHPRRGPPSQEHSKEKPQRETGLGGGIKSFYGDSALKRRP